MVLIGYKKRIAQALSDFESFWDISLLQDDPDQCKSVQTSLKLYKYGITAAFTVSFVQVIALVSIPLFAEGRQLPFALWLPDDSASPFYEFVFALQTFTLVSLLSIAIGIDALFISFCGSLAVQFKLLAHRLRGLEGGGIPDALRECVTYHKRLLG